MDVDATSGQLTISTADGTTDQLYSFTSSKTDYQTLLEKLDTATTNVSNAAATFGTAGNRIDMQKDFLDKLVDTLTTGLGALVDADMSEEAARLQALQVQEQLGTQALSIANQAPQSILSLFR
ncbi:flagellin [Teichococcus aestuarii]|uniref:flagellin n=1 Tax=Teichococcus aestuarii TaxID=568898 RepID=UPI0036239629